MVFSDLFFIYGFMTIVLILYFLCRTITQKNIIVVIMSLLFYAWGEPTYVWLLILSTTINYFCGLAIDKFRDKTPSKVVLTFSILLNLGFLGVFKYSGFVIENLNSWFGLGLSVPDVDLPIGISFYTFQIISYIVDCYWENIKVQKNYLKFLMYVSMFPQLVAGPIVRYSVIEKEIDKRSTTLNDISDGLIRFSIGLGKKVIIANNLSSIVDTFFSNGGIEYCSTVASWYAVVCYAMQVYFDFSGYSDMAIGLGRILGFHFDENFKHPFLCRDITEFWQRWHISLGSFFRDYLLYLPIFGRRNQYFNLFLVWFSTGLWHGASWNYIIWGLYFGVFILIEKKIGKKKLKKVPSIIMHIYNKLVIIIGFGIFYFENINELGIFFKSIVGLNGIGLIDSEFKVTFMNNLFLFIGAIVLTFPIFEPIQKLANSKTSRGKVFVGNLLQTAICLSMFLFSSILLVDATNNPFLYFKF